MGFKTNLKAGIGAEGKGKGQAKGFMKTLSSQIEAERQRQRPSQGVHKNALKPGPGLTAKAKARPGDV